MIAAPPQLKRIPMSRAEYDALPEGPPYYDYICGEAIEVNKPRAKHQRIMSRLETKIGMHIGPTDMGFSSPDSNLELPTGDVTAPDIVYISKKNLTVYDEERGYFIGVPDLVVEIQSPSTKDYDRVGKRTTYHRAGVSNLWYVEQESLNTDEFQWSEQGYVLVNGTDADGIFRPLLFPGLEINLENLLAGIMG